MTKERIQIPVLDIDIENSFEAISKFYHQLTERIKRDSHRKYIMMHFAEQSYYGKNKGEWILENCCKGFVIKNVREFYRRAKIGKAILKTIDTVAHCATNFNYDNYYGYLDVLVLREISDWILEEGSTKLTQFHDLVSYPRDFNRAELIEIIQKIKNPDKIISDEPSWKKQFEKLKSFEVEKLDIEQEYNFFDVYAFRVLSTLKTKRKDWSPEQYDDFINTVKLLSDNFLTNDNNQEG